MLMLNGAASRVRAQTQVLGMMAERKFEKKKLVDARTRRGELT